MFKELAGVDRVEISHDSFIEENNGENSSDFHLELVEVLSPCHAVLNNLPCQMATYDIVISRKFPRMAFFNKEPFSANFPGFYNSMSKKPTITAFFEVYDNIF